MTTGIKQTYIPQIDVAEAAQRLRRGQAVLAAAGVDVSNVTGGMKAWEAAGLPVVIDGGAPGVVP